jgi:hypothetical protein
LGRRKRGWKAASGLSLDALQELVEAKHAQLTARREELAAELAAIDADLGGVGPKGVVRRGPGRPKGRRGPGRPPGTRGPGRPKGSKNKPKAGGKRGRKAGPKGQSDLHNAIRAVLKNSAEPMKLVDVAAKVKANGYETKSKNFPVILGLRLSEMKDVKRVDRGVYTMR